MIVDSAPEYQEMLNEIQNEEIFLHLFSSDPRLHAMEDSVCLACICIVNGRENYGISMHHPDVRFSVSFENFVSDISSKAKRIWCIDKKKILHFSNRFTNLHDINSYVYNMSGNFLDIEEVQIPAATKLLSRFYSAYSNLNEVIPFTIHLRYFENLCSYVIESIPLGKQMDESYKRFNVDLIAGFAQLESNGIAIDCAKFKNYFPNYSSKIGKNNLVYTEYNIFTSTGRPSNCFGKINYAALPKESGCRESFVSRYGEDGYLFMVDYSAYHPHLIARLVNYNLPDDAYRYLGKFYFDKETLSDDELKASKILTFQLLYGNIPDEYLAVPYFSKIKNYIEHRWKYFIQYGYVETPIFKRRITPENIKDANANKLFNYILQAAESEYNVVVLNRINELLNNDEIKTKAVLYTYDSILFDVSNQDKNIELEIIRTMRETHGFPVKCYRGKNYHQMERISSV